MCDPFVTGVASPQLQSRLSLEGDTLTFDHAIEIALLSERAKLQSEGFSNSVERITCQNPRRSSTFCRQFVAGTQGAAKRHLRMPAMLLSGACLICEYQRPGTACVVAK
ncbi:hypothetical protein MRX96_029028 [Rhipicephalus microplus]